MACLTPIVQLIRQTVEHFGVYLSLNCENIPTGDGRIELNLFHKGNLLEFWNLNAKQCGQIIGRAVFEGARMATDEEVKKGRMLRRLDYAHNYRFRQDEVEITTSPTMDHDGFTEYEVTIKMKAPLNRSDLWY